MMSRFILRDKENWISTLLEVCSSCRTDFTKHKEFLSKKNKDYFNFCGNAGMEYDEQDYSYWKEYLFLYEKLVPESGVSKTINGEAIRIISRLIYEYYNNGNCNLQEVVYDDCNQCGGGGYEECSHYLCEQGYIDDENNEKVVCSECDGDFDTYIDCQYCGGDCRIETGTYEIDNYYSDMFEFLRINFYSTNNGLQNACENLKDMLENFYCYGYIDKELYKNRKITDYYNTFADELMYVILTSKTNQENPQYCNEITKV